MGDSGSVPSVSLEDSGSFISKLFLLYLNPLFAKGAEYERLNQKAQEKRSSESERNAADLAEFQEVIHQLEHSDLGPASKMDRTGPLYEIFYRELEKERRKPSKNRSLWFILWRTVGFYRLFVAILLYTLYTASSFGPIMILNALAKHFEGTSHLSTAEVWIFVVLIFILPMIGTVLSAQSNVILVHCGVQFRNCLIAAIYRKSLKLSSAAKQQSSTGQIVNMFSTDTAQMMRFLQFLNNIVIAAPTIAVCMTLIYFQLGVAAFVGLGLIVVIIPFNGVIFKWLGNVRRRKVFVTDRRVKAMNEILNGIRIIKYYAWEDAFRQRVEGIREQELKLLWVIAYIIAVGFSIVLMAVPVFLPVLIFYTYIRLGNQLDAAKAFTAISLFNLLQFPFIFLPLGLAQYSQSRVSTKRILNFLELEELSNYVERLDNKQDSEDNIKEGNTLKQVVIAMENASLGWIRSVDSEDKQENGSHGPRNGTKGDYAPVPVNTTTDGANHENGTTAAAKEDTPRELEMVVSSPSSSSSTVSATLGHEPNSGAGGDGELLLMNRSIQTLSGLNFSVKSGELVAIVGTVGSGKSSLLNALLGEMILLSGHVKVIGSVAYCDQRPWILNDTVQGNILFGRPYNEAKFDFALHCANLEEDIALLPGGVNTQIGERGINLSGGQKARVAFARAIYSDAELYFLDDPLSAVDAHVGQLLFHEGIRNGLQGKTRLLVTHQLHFLPYFDKIILLDQGQIKVIGTYEEIVKSGIDIESLIPSKTLNSGEDDEQLEGEQSDGGKRLPQRDRKIEGTTPSGTDSFDVQREKSAQLSKNRRTDTRSTTLNTKEERSQGFVPFGIYHYYIKAGGTFRALGVLICLLISQGFTLLASYWLSHWGAVSRDHQNSGSPLSAHRNTYYLDIFALLSCLSLLFYIFRSIWLANLRLVASRLLHSHLVRRILGAPVAFFDVTPIGRILNRFSSDMQTIDEEIMQTVSSGLNAFANVLGALGAIAGATKGTFLLLLVPIGYFYVLVNRFFRATNTSIARLEAISRSPMYADFSQALAGAISVRAYQDEERFIRRLEEKVDSNSIAVILQQVAAQWLAMRLDFIGAIVSFFIAVLAASDPHFISPGYFALALTYSFQMTTYLKFVVRVLAQLEAQMNSVDRVKHYIENVQVEDVSFPPSTLSTLSTPPTPSTPSSSSASTTMDIVPANWPNEGRIEIEDLQLKYRDGPFVLKGLSFAIRGGEKIGVAGRTGSGKSSLMVGLFRIESFLGTIKIDGVDISKIPLSKLRSRIGIIPQDPVMFNATIRFNLDPFEQYSDMELWSALESVTLKEYVSSLPKKIDEEIIEGGENFSAGQRQLICIARALLRKTKILVLDEATASIDNETDTLLQQMIRKEFQDCTVLTIAHRLHTIIDSDRIMLLHDGKIAEFASPQSLLDNSHGMFFELWQKHIKSHQN